MLNRYANGFTIVELLIVIVVIAILAAITIVVYSGAQTKAENTKTTAAVTTYVRAIRSYATINGTYPVTGAGVYACFGAPAGGKCGNVIDATAGVCGANTAPATTNATFDNAVKTVLYTLPTPSTQSITCGTRSYAGAHYLSTNGATGNISYYLRGNQTCGGIGGLESLSSTYTSDVTVCSGQLLTLP